MHALRAALVLPRGIATHSGQLPNHREGDKARDKRPELTSLPPIVTFTVIYGGHGDSRWIDQQM